MPISLTPRRINGYTVVCIVRGCYQTTTGYYAVILRCFDECDRMFPPTVSIAAAQRPDRMGRPVSSSNVRRSMTLDAPSFFKKSVSDAFPVAATTRKAVFGQYRHGEAAYATGCARYYDVALIWLYTCSMM